MLSSSGATTEMSTPMEDPREQILVPSTFELTAKDLGEELVIFQVGTNSERISIHRRLLCKRSKYFANLLDEAHGVTENNIVIPENPYDFMEEVCGNVILVPEGCFAAFEMMINYFYQNQVASFQRSVPNIDGTPVVDQIDRYVHTLRALFFLGSMYYLDPLSNMVMDKFQDLYFRTSGMFNDLGLHYLYCLNQGPSKLRDYAVLQQVWSLIHHKRPDLMATLGWVMEDYPDFVSEFTVMQLEHTLDVSDTKRKA